MTNKEIIQQISTIRDEIAEKEKAKEKLFDQLKANYPIQPGDKVRVTTPAWNYTKEKTLPPDVKVGIVGSLRITSNIVIPDIYPIKKDGTPAKVGVFYPGYNSKIEKI